MSQYDAREVADLLSRFNFKILREQEGDFSPSHRKYLCEFSRPGYETFSTSYQCNPEVHGQPTAADVFAALVSDALAVDGLLNFYIPVTFGVDRVFGTDVESLDNDDWLNIYANYDMARGEVSDHLDISLNRADGSIESLTYPLDAEQRKSLRQKMDAYCLEQVGKTLDDYVKEVAESEADSDAAHIADFTVGKYRVHIVPPGGTYGLDNRMTYSLGDADEYGHGLPLVEFYDITQDPVKFPGGQFTGGRYYMSTLLGMESLGDSIENMQALSLDGSIPAWTVGREDLQTIYRHLCDIRENFPGTPSERKVNLKDEAVSSRNASQALANGIGYDDRVQDAR